jgi:outer membrane lipoprotein-sorting protein
MRVKAYTLVSLLLGFFLNLSLAVRADLSAEEILDKAVNNTYPETYQMTAQMVSTKQDKEDRVYKMEIFKKGSDKMLIVFTEPAREKDRKILRNGNSIWMYIPNVQKVLKVAEKQSVMGGDFSNADLMRLDLVSDYNASLAGEEKMDGVNAYRLELKAKDRSVAYDRVTVWVRKDNLLPMKSEFYTLSGKLLKILTYSNLKRLAGQVRPTKMTMENTLEEGQLTIFTFDDLRIKDTLPDNIFTQTYLSR